VSGAALPVGQASAARLNPLTLVRALRPRQWTKNLAVYAPLLFAKKVFDVGALKDSTYAVLSFCMLASAVYVLNDWIDREKDRLHPDKRKRPIAAGLIRGPMALALGIGCAAVGFTLAYLARAEFARVAAGYVCLQILYSFGLKRVVILDVMLIAIGFVIRVVGGGGAIEVPVSNWLYLCTLLLAVFLGFAKRRHELSSLDAQAGEHRASLSDYSLPMLDQMISVVAAACIVAFGLYTVSKDTVDHVGSDKLKYSLPLVIYGIFRYLFLIHKRNAGGSPERVLLSDAPLLADLMLFVGLVGWVLYVG
jgi:4-hydroxybenzoate polyprenyltransferase